METRAYIDGHFVTAERRFAVVDPADGETIAEVVDCGPAQIEAALDSASRAFASWRGLSAGARAERIHALAEAMRRDEDRLARLLTREQGKPLAEARGEVAYAAGFLTWSAEEGQRIAGETLPAPSADKRIFVLPTPVGPSVAITPWNFPLAMITRKLAPALAAGCPMTVKPAEQTPLSGLAIAALAHEVGFPPGVINLLPMSDPRPFGARVGEDPRVRKISFTGSTEVGRTLVAAAAGNLARLSLELGGQAPVLVFDDADLERAVEGIMAAKFRNAGQTCVCINRIFAQRGIYERLLDALHQEVASLRVGAGGDPGVQVGPLIDEAAVAKVEAHVEDARARGAVLRCGGARLPALGERFYAPTLLSAATPQMRVMREETFGPVAPIAVFDEEDEGLALANATPYGLAAYFFTRDAARLMRVAEGLEFGIVGANDGRPSAIMAPFGGVKASGWGREGGKYGVAAYLEPKYLSWAL